MNNNNRNGQFFIRKSGEQRRIKGPEMIVESSKNQRDENSLSIRKQKKNEHISKRRNLNLINNSQEKERLEETMNQEAAQVEQIPFYLTQLQSEDLRTRIEGTTKFRRLLAIEKDSPISEVIMSGAVKYFIQFLHVSNETLQYEAAWCLTNIASGNFEHANHLMKEGVVAAILPLLSHPSDDLRAQVIWCLGNIAGDGPQGRDWILSHNAMNSILSQIQEGASLNLVRISTWTVSNLCRGKPLPKFEWVASAIPTLAGIIHTEDEDVLTDICWAFSHLTEGGHDKVQLVIERGIVRRMTELMLHHNLAIQTPALRTIGNIVTGDDFQTQVVLNVSALPCLAALLSSPKKAIVKEACWAISNITAGSKEQIEQIIRHGLIPDLVDLISEGDLDIRKEAAWAISNATACGTDDQIRYIVEQKAIKPFCNLLDTNQDIRLLGVCLEAIENILRVGERDAEQTGFNKYSLQVDQVEGFDKIEKLTLSNTDCIVTKSTRIINNYLKPYAEVEEVAPIFGKLGVPLGTNEPLRSPPKSLMSVAMENHQSPTNTEHSAPKVQANYSPQSLSTQSQMTFNFLQSDSPQQPYNF